MPLSHLSIPERAYLAGIVDGEGSISLVRCYAPRTRGRYVYPLVRVANTERSLIEWITNRITIGAKQYKSNLNIRCKDVYHIGWASNEAIHVLRAVMPYLVIKKLRAEIVLELWQVNEEARLAAGGYFGNYHPLPDWLVEKREFAFAEMQRLNARGIAPVKMQPLEGELCL